ncbi:MAG: hypothetical protein IJT27_03025 [Clostridia bacterium]|nr:hypothetical protein [Clostridia bacterium]
MNNEFDRTSADTPAEVNFAAREFPSVSAPEFFPPPPEFGTGPADANTRPKKKRRRSFRYLALPAVLILGFLCLNAGVPDSKPDVTPTQTDETQPAAPEETTAEPETQPAGEPAPYPLEDREMLITVYTGTLDSNYEIEILLQQRVNELSFETLALDAPEDIDLFSFYGYVIHAGNPMLRPDEEPPGTKQVIIPIGQTLTKEAVEKTPIASDGVRYVDIYANWISDTDPATSEQLFTLDDGMGHKKAFDASNPLYSEGFLYIEAYPETEREGYIFDGYYNAAGERVYALQSFMDFYEPGLYDEYGNVIDIDMSRPLDVVLTAHWIPVE